MLALQVSKLLNDGNCAKPSNMITMGTKNTIVHKPVWKLTLLQLSAADEG